MLGTECNYAVLLALGLCVLGEEYGVDVVFKYDGCELFFLLEMIHRKSVKEHIVLKL